MGQKSLQLPVFIHTRINGFCLQGFFHNARSMYVFWCNTLEEKSCTASSVLHAFLGFLFWCVLPSSLAVCVHLSPLLLCFNCKCCGRGRVIFTGSTCAGPKLLALVLWCNAQWALMVLVIWCSARHPSLGHSVVSRCRITECWHHVATEGCGVWGQQIPVQWAVEEFWGQSIQLRHDWWNSVPLPAHCRVSYPLRSSFPPSHLCLLILHLTFFSVHPAKFGFVSRLWDAVEQWGEERVLQPTFLVAHCISAVKMHSSGFGRPKALDLPFLKLHSRMMALDRF